MIAPTLAWLLVISTALFWWLYKRTHDRAERLDKRICELQRTIALQEQRVSQEQTRVSLEQQRGQVLEQAIQQQTERIGVLVALNNQLTQKLSARQPHTIHLPVIGRIYVN